MPRWHFGSPPIPATAVLLSVLALLVPLAAITAAGTDVMRFEALVWLTALIPAFLLAYYRGWQGVATGLALGMAVFSVAQVFLVLSGTRLPDWPLMLSITAAFAGVALVLGGVTERLHAERENAEQLALHDSLTGLPNRRYLELILEREFAAAERGRAVVLIAFDLDGLKRINDRQGHSAGDEAICAFARVLEHNTRAMDLSARLGGDEFVSVLSSSSIEGAMVFVRRVQAAVEQIEAPQPLSVSAGLASYSRGFRQPHELLDAADRVLYEAKKQSVGGVMIAPDSLAVPAPESQAQDQPEAQAAS